MKFSCEKAVLQSAIDRSGRAVAAKSTIPALEGMLIRAREGVIDVSGYDLEIGIITTVSADVSEEGAVILPARLFTDIIRRLQDDVVTIKCDERQLASIRCGKASFDIMGMPPEDFPDMPEVRGEHGLSIALDKLSSMIDETIFCVSTNENKLVHTGVLFDAEDDILRLVAVDGFRLAVREETLDERMTEKLCVVIPAKTVRELSKMQEPDAVARFILSDRHVSIELGETVITSRLLEGEFLDYRKSIPTDMPVSVRVDVKELQSSIARVSLLINERVKSPLRMSFLTDMISLSCQTGLGSGEDICPSEGEGGEVLIGFNNRYISDAIKAVSDEYALIQLKNGLSPCLITPEEGNRFLYMVLPVRLKSDG